MPQRLVFADAPSAADLLTFAGRAARIGDTAVRLQAHDGTLVATTAVLAPRGLLDATPTVLALRVLSIDPELRADLAVTASALVADTLDALAVTLPESAVAPSWAGISPPRGGWGDVGRLSAAALAARAQWGIAAVADALPTDAGEDVLHAVRADVWGAPDPALLDLPRGVAFAAFAMGFIVGDEDVAVRRSGTWTRLTLARGHVLVRGPVASGLTAVRRTGSPPPH